jgi:hypothetical protein
MSKPINYWIVNNPYHINDIDLYNSRYEGKNIFIAIEHRKIPFDKSQQVYFFKKYKGFFWFLVSYFKLLKGVKKMAIRKIDRIFIFNGQEHTNNILLSFIVKKYCNNIIIVDDGSTGYQFYLSAPVFSKKISDTIKLFLFRIFGVSYDVKKVDNLYYNCINSKFVKKIIFPYFVSHEGDIEVECFQKKFDNRKILNGRHAIFLSQPFYLADPGCLTFNAYLELLEKILWLLSKKYEKVFLKLHPNEHSILFELISNKAIPNIEIIEGGFIFEKIIDDLAVKYLISFNSNALLSALGSNHETIWLYKLLPKQYAITCAYLNRIISQNNGKIIEDLTEL